MVGCDSSSQFESTKLDLEQILILSKKVGEEHNEILDLYFETDNSTIAPFDGIMRAVNQHQSEKSIFNDKSLQTKQIFGLKIVKKHLNDNNIVRTKVDSSDFSTSIISLKRNLTNALKSKEDSLNVSFISNIMALADNLDLSDSDAIGAAKTTFLDGLSSKVSDSEVIATLTFFDVALNSCEFWNKNGDTLKMSLGKTSMTSIAAGNGETLTPDELQGIIALDAVGAAGSAAISAIMQWSNSGSINGWTVLTVGLIGGATTSLGPWARAL